MLQNVRKDSMYFKYFKFHCYFRYILLGHCSQTFEIFLKYQQYFSTFGKFTFVKLCVATIRNIIGRLNTHKHQAKYKKPLKSDANLKVQKRFLDANFGAGK